MPFIAGQSGITVSGTYDWDYYRWWYSNSRYNSIYNY